MRVVAILQVRMGSTRLPGKSMMPLAGKPMVQNIIDRVQRAKRLDQVILAPPHCDWEAFWEFRQCTYHAPLCAENDLVGRYLAVAEQSRADVVVRVPCDNPCVDHEYIDQAIEAYCSGKHIFYTNTVTDVSGVMMDGLGCEVLSLSRLKILDLLTKDRPDYREHPHKWFYDHLPIRDPASNLRLDVNTLSDYQFIEKIYKHFGHNRFTAREILACPSILERLRVS